MSVLSGAGCASNRLYNDAPSLYLTSVVAGNDMSVGVDLAVIEFDEFGMLWLPEQLEAAIDLIDRRNNASDRGIIVVTYTHGWQNNADSGRVKNDLARFRVGMAELGRELHAQGGRAPDHVVGVYLGWRGATNRLPLWKNLSFWDRKDAAERIASHQMRETLFRLTATAKARPDSKVLLSGHSMGGMILARTLAPTLSTLLLASGPDGVFAPSDMVLLQNPALDGLAAYQFIEYLKRNNARVELRHADGRVEPAAGPIIASVTSEADWVTRVAYPAGQMYENMSRAFRDDIDDGVPSQSTLSNHAHGHLKFLISHRARVDNGEVILEPVEGAYNDTPFWIVQASQDICKDHGDIYNERFVGLVRQITELNRLYDSNVETWIRPSRPSIDAPPNKDREHSDAVHERERTMPQPPRAVSKCRALPVSTSDYERAVFSSMPNRCSVAATASPSSNAATTRRRSVMPYTLIQGLHTGIASVSTTGRDGPRRSRSLYMAPADSANRTGYARYTDCLDIQATKPNDRREIR
ncbi:MAG: hypothetical protein AAF823_04850 [Planctomycetota bacterium]